MIRQKTIRLLITFSSTQEAMKMEAVCRDNHLRGRLIPLPTKISAGCGLAYRTETELKQTAMNIMRDNNIRWEAMYEMELF